MQYGILIDSDNTIITHKSDDYMPSVDKDGNENKYKYSDASIPDKCISSDDVNVKTGFDYNNSLMVFTSDKIGDYGWTFIYVDSALAYYMCIILFVIVSIILLVISYFAFRKPVRKMLLKLFTPLESLNKAADNMSKGILDYKSDYREDDEIGNVCIAIEESNKEIEKYIYDISEKLKQMSNGDFTTQITMEYIGDFEPLKTSFNDICNTMNNTMVGLKKAADSVYNSAENVSSGAQKLAKDVTYVATIVNDVNSEVESVNNKFEENKNQTNESVNVSQKTKEQQRLQKIQQN